MDIHTRTSAATPHAYRRLLLRNCWSRFHTVCRAVALRYCDGWLGRRGRERAAAIRLLAATAVAVAAGRWRGIGQGDVDREGRRQSEHWEKALGRCCCARAKCTQATLNRRRHRRQHRGQAAHRARGGRRRNSWAAQGSRDAHAAER